MIVIGETRRAPDRWRFERALVFERARGVAEAVASLGRVTRIRIFHPGVEVALGTSIAPGVTVRCAPGSTIRLRGVAIGRGVHLETVPGAVMDLAGRSIGPGAILVARERITMLPGSVLAETTVVRDADHVLRGVELSDGLYRSAPVVIGRDACVLSKAILLRGVTVGDRAVVAAGAVVTADVPPGTVVGGVPARPIALRGGPVPEPGAAPVAPAQRGRPHSEHHR
jgi:acetyltransferase-like isoleucine patch superfamily enzyme